ncbi:ATP-binding protein [Pleionea sp. CnH1-48]|uniref:sensor histidine kinase n=1 Tax=Pleionea sp. CnH1-48 TaxID=2954494 RepID=UPI002097F1F5|nr:ATP-binding protein [Pleionea sp. CnH1-48]MCO7223492.1 ATP-binding protein [Pleionea sp. CnH1-48]
MQILLVEDNQDHALLIQDLIGSAFSDDTSVHTEENLLPAMDLLSDKTFDICLCDLQLPDSSIGETIDRLKQIETCVPIIILTSINDENVAHKLLTYGMQDFLPKDELNINLLHRICTYAIKRKQQQILLEERTSDMEAFCRSLSHDFKGMVRRIGSSSKIIQEKLGEAITEELSDWFRLLDTNVNAIGALEKGLYDYLSTNNLAIVTTEVDLNVVVEEVCATLEGGEDQSYNIAVSELPSINGVRSQLFILFYNLIQNAIKYNENEPKINIAHQFNKKSHSHVITFKDNGIGMKEEYLKKIFSPFYRLHSDRKYQGSGLGLSIVKRIVENHGADIRVESKEGSGSCFFVSFSQLEH